VSAARNLVLHPASPMPVQWPQQHLSLIFIQHQATLLWSAPEYPEAELFSLPDDLLSDLANAFVTGQPLDLGALILNAEGELTRPAVPGCLAPRHITAQLIETLLRHRLER